MSRPTIRVRVAHKAVEALDICTFELVPADGGTLPPFSAGSHVDVHLPAGVVRQYSLCNDPSEGHRYVIAVLKVPDTRGGSKAMHEQIHEGDELQISEPKNHFPLAHGATRHLLMAGGIGVTPILCMAERLALIGEDFEMHYCTRSQDRTAFKDRIRRSAFASQVQFHFDDGEAAQKLDLATLLARPQPGVQLYVCGPKGFMDAVLGTARAQGWPEDQLNWEFFSAEVKRSSADEDFDIVVASSGRVVTIPANRTVAQALSEAGIFVPTSCEQGICGTCLTRVLEGEPDHRDLYLTPEEQSLNDQFTPCCSRSKTARLVLDL